MRPRISRKKRALTPVGLHYIGASGPPERMDRAASANERAGGRDPRWRLRGQRELQLIKQHRLVGVGFGIAREDQRAAVGGRELHIEHLDRGKLIEHRARREPGSERFQFRSQCHMQAVTHEGNKDVRLNAMLELMVDRAQPQIVF